MVRLMIGSDRQLCFLYFGPIHCYASPPPPVNLVQWCGGVDDAVNCGAGGVLTGGPRFEFTRNVWCLVTVRTRVGVCLREGACDPPEDAGADRISRALVAGKWGRDRGGGDVTMVVLYIWTHSSCYIFGPIHRDAPPPPRRRRIPLLWIW